jgi:protein-disulfide isomerase
LEQNTKQALFELKMEAVVEKVTEIQDIMSYGIMSTPALVVDGALLMVGMVPDVEQIKKALANNKPSNNSAGTCACGGAC